MADQKTVTQLFGELGEAIDQAAEVLDKAVWNWEPVSKKFAVVYTCARCGRQFSHPIPLDHVCVTIIETTARDVPPNTLLLPEGGQDA